MTIQIIHGDCLEVMPMLEENSVDSAVMDPPYHLASIVKRFGKDGSAPAKSNGETGVYARASKGFMGKEWDGGDVAFRPETWAEVLRVLKPGGYLVAFNHSRSWHRMAVAIEDAGFEIRDTIMWLYGSGFPKSHDVGKAIDRATGAERNVVSEGKPVKRMIPGADQNKTGWVKDNGREFVPTVTEPATDEARQWDGWGTALKPAHEPIVVARKPLIGTVAENVLEHRTGGLNIDGCRVEPTGESRERNNEASQNKRYTDKGSTNFAVKPGVRGGGPTGRWPANIIHDGSEEVLAAFPSAPGQQRSVGPEFGDKKSVNTYGDYGPREHFMPRIEDDTSAARFFYSAKADAGDRLGSKHPTVKPVDLMAYLCRLVTPPGGVVLDPFAGSGTTAMACLREGFNAILIEKEAEYVADIKKRIAHVHGTDLPLFEGAAQ